jgi:hypothetical protein
MNSTAPEPLALKSNLVLGPDATDCDKVLLTLADLHVLAATAERNDTRHNFQAVALQWAAGAQAEIERLRAEVARLTPEPPEQWHLSIGACGKCGHPEACAAMGCKTPNVADKRPVLGSA